VARPENPSSIYLDSNPLIIGALKREGYEPIAEILRLADAGAVSLYISSFSYVEVRGFGVKEPYDRDVDQLLLGLLDSSRLQRVDVPRAVAVRARRYAHQYTLGNFDAVHLASAVVAGAEVLMTWDKGFSKRRGYAVDGVWIDEPYVPGPPMLDFPVP